MTVDDIIAQLESLGIDLSADGDKLRVSAARGQLNDELKQAIGAHKSELLEFLARRSVGPSSSRTKQNQSIRLDEPVLEPQARGATIPLSFAQQRLWFLDQLTPGSAEYVLPWSLRWKGQLDLAVLERSLAEIVRRHEVLRTVFGVSEGIPSQVILPAGTVAIPVIDLSHLPPQERESEARQRTIANALEGFDLTTGPLFRVGLIRLGAGDYVLLFAVHHSVFDGSSSTFFAAELSTIYNAYLAGTPSPLPEPIIQYADFSLWQRQLLDGRRKVELAYWKQELGAHAHPLELPADRPRSTVHSSNGRKCYRQLNARLTENLKLLSRNERVSLFMVLMSVFQLLMHRLSGQKEFFIGTPVAGRNRLETERLIGFFVNTVVMRADFSQPLSFRDLLVQVRRAALNAFEHQDMPFEELVSVLEPRRDLSRTPLFQVFFNHLSMEVPQLEIEGVTVEPFGDPSVEAKFDLTLYVGEQNRALSLLLVYNQDLFDDVRANEMLEQYSSLLAQVCVDPGGSVEGFSLLTESMRARIPDPLVALESRSYESIVDRFLKHAAARPDYAAVEDATHMWSYADLERLSHRLTACLRARDVRRGDVVGIYGHRSALFVLALLGVLRAGAAICVFDPAYPALRLCQNIRAGRPKAWIHVGAAGEPPDTVLSLLTELVGTRRIDLPFPVDSEHLSRSADDSIESGDALLDSPAYVTFTSGTTGQPKSVLGTHRPLSHFLEWHSANFNLTANDRFSMLSGLAHDPLLRDVFTPLWLGATLCIPRPDEILRPGYVADWMHNSRISVSHLTPAMGALMAEGTTRQLPELRHVFFGGDMLTPRVAMLVHGMAPAAEIVNFYGTTETPQAMAWHRIDPASLASSDEHAASTRSPIPIGKSVPDAQILILNRTRELAGVGELGEIFVRTPYLTLGYANDQELTRDRFVVNPFTGDTRDRLYRTGDMARYRPDGLVEFVGRDDQVKIRGYRVELGEIEVALIAHKGVGQCVVTAPKDPNGAPRLVAYVVRATASTPTTQDLRAYLATVLPDHMIPSAFVFLEALPLTPNGKIDRHALPIPADESDPVAKGYVQPRNGVEAALAVIWAKVLGVETVSVFADFFALGGHSLLATQLIARIKAELGIDLPLRSLFVEPTIAGLSTRIVFNESTQTYQYQDDNKHQWKRLVPAQTKGSRIPFFFVAGYMDADGTLAVLSHIIPRLGPDQPVYGLQPRWLDGSSEPYSTVEEVVREFVAELRAFRPDGPYFLGGDCVGGVVALEMARELTRQGAEVGILVMFDTERPTVFRASASALRHVWRRAMHVGSTIWKILRSDFSAKGRIVRELLDRKLRALQPQKARDARESEAERVYRLRNDYRRMIYRHRITEYSGRITLFICEQMYRSDKNLGWARVAKENLEVHVAPGDHWNRYTSHGREFAVLLDSCFRRVQQQIAERSGQSASRV